jgi:hypothetical protein
MVDNFSVSIYPLQSSNEIILFTPRTNPLPSANSPVIFDFMSGLQLDPTLRKTIDIGGNVYDAEFLGDFIASEEIWCNPIHNLTFTLENLECLWNLFKTNNNNILENRLQHIISLYKQNNNLILHSKSKSIKYFENLISTCVIKLLAYCELGNESMERSDDDQIACDIWTNLLHSFCCLIRLSPLNAIKSGANLIKSFTETLVYFKNYFDLDNSSEKVNYNSTKLLVISGCVKKLVEQINAGVVSGNVKDTISNINKNLKIKFLSV